MVYHIGDGSLLVLMGFAQLLYHKEPSVFNVKHKFFCLKALIFQWIQLFRRARPDLRRHICFKVIAGGRDETLSFDF